MTEKEKVDDIDYMEEVGAYNYELLCHSYDPSIVCERTERGARWDIEHKSKTGDVVVEIKVRDYRINDFPDLYVDKGKIDALREEFVRNKKRPFLVCFYHKDNKVVIWDVLKEYELMRRLVNKCTVESRGNKIYKDVYSLVISKGVKLDYNFKWLEREESLL